MSERYVVKKHPEFSSWQVWDTVDNVQVSRSWWERFDAQEHADKCNGKLAEIASLQEANADLLAAAEAQSEKLGEARNFIRELADRPLDIHDDYRHVIYNSVVIAAKNMAKQWEAQEAEKQKAEQIALELENEAVTAQSRFKVGDRVIDDNGDIGTVFAVSVDEAAEAQDSAGE